MANNYIGANNVARKVKNYYIGVNGVARKVKKMYVGVNGRARLCYEENSVPTVAVTFALYSTIAIDQAAGIRINNVALGTLYGLADDTDLITLRVPVGATIQVNGEGTRVVPMRYVGAQPSSAFSNVNVTTTTKGIIFVCSCQAAGQLNFTIG